MLDIHSVLIVGVAALVTILIRFLPFLIFRNQKSTPAFITYLGRVLPYSIMAMLVVFCLKDVSIEKSPHGIPELISCILVVGTYVWKKNTLLSIVLGTVCYMLLVQLVFVA